MRHFIVISVESLGFVGKVQNWAAGAGAKPIKKSIA
jgi:hypothetical protein